MGLQHLGSLVPGWQDRRGAGRGQSFALLANSASDWRAHGTVNHMSPLACAVCAVLRGREGYMATPSETADGNQICVKGLVVKTYLRGTGGKRALI